VASINRIRERYGVMSIDSLGMDVHSARKRRRDASVYSVPDRKKLLHLL
jgi:hypothetical protein